MKSGYVESRYLGDDTFIVGVGYGRSVTFRVDHNWLVEYVTYCCKCSIQEVEYCLQERKVSIDDIYMFAAFDGVLFYQV